MRLTSLAFSVAARLKRGYAAGIWPDDARVKARETHSGADVQVPVERWASWIREAEVRVAGVTRRTRRAIRRS